MGDWPTMFQLLGAPVLLFFFALTCIEVAMALVKESASE